MNNISFNGIEIIIGGSIIMPALSKTLAMTISISKNGINNRHPISKAVRNSLITKAGITTCSPMSIGLLGRSIFAICTNSARSAGLHCRSINSLMESLRLLRCCLEVNLVRNIRLNGVDIDLLQRRRHCVQSQE